MKLFIKVIEAHCKALIALSIMLLFLCDASWALARTTPAEKILSAGSAGSVATVLPETSEGARAGSEKLFTATNGEHPDVTCTPPGANIVSSGNLSCRNKTITLDGTSAEASVTYLWSGPEGYSSMLPQIVASLPGTYTLTVTRSSDAGCMSTTSVEVTQDIALPGATASVSHALDCANTSVTLQAGTSITGATFRWIGNNFVSLVQNPAITAPGGYTLNVTNPVNGCTSTATVNVTQSITSPGVTPSV